MLFSGLRSAEVRALAADYVDIALGWVRVLRKGEKERRVPVDREVCALVQSYLLTERPESGSLALFFVAKSPTRGQPLTAARCGLCSAITAARSGVSAGNPHALRHTFGTRSRRPASICRSCRRCSATTTSTLLLTYVHLAPAHSALSYDAARTHQN